MLINKERFFDHHVNEWEENAGIESMSYDREGHLYVASRSGMQVCSLNGYTQVILHLQNGRATGICFGRANLDILFAFVVIKYINAK